METETKNSLCLQSKVGQACRLPTLSHLHSGQSCHSLRCWLCTVGLYKLGAEYTYATHCKYQQNGNINDFQFSRKFLPAFSCLQSSPLTTMINFLASVTVASFAHWADDFSHAFPKTTGNFFLNYSGGIDKESLGDEVRRQKWGPVLSASHSIG